MPTVAANIAVAWPSTNASIPSGWSRETALDTRFIQGAATAADADLTTDRGNTTHTHTSPSHTPTQNSHTHLVIDLGDDGTSLVAGFGSPSVNMSPIGHFHVGVLGDTGTAFNSGSTTATNNGIAITVNANTTNDPPYVKVIWIKSDGTPTGIPNAAYAFFSSDTLPSGWSRVQGNTYLKGADASGGDGGGTGGSTTHGHTSPAHTHTQNSHTHSGNSPTGDIATARKSTAGTNYSRSSHVHTITGAAATATNNSVTTTINDATNVEPVYKKLNIISNGTGGADLPDQVIAVWLGTHAGIPTDWARFTSMDGYFVKGANANGESNVTTGGATQHNHTASNCQPTQNAHSHSWSGTGGSTSSSATGTGVSISGSGHTHTWSEDTDGGVYPTATNNSIAVTIDNCTAEDAYPKYRRVIFVQYTTPSVSTSVKDLIGIGMIPFAR